MQALELYETEMKHMRERKEKYIEGDDVVPVFKFLFFAIVDI